MTQNFQERFKNKANFIGKQGNINVDALSAISKPHQHQIFTPNTPLYIEEKQISNSPDLISNTNNPDQKNSRRSRHPEPFNRIQAHSAKPFRNTDIQRKEIRTRQENKLIQEYKPYTLKDYQIIKTDKYYELGGLGPANIGTEE